LKIENTAIGIRHAVHMAPSTGKSWHYVDKRRSLDRYSSLRDSGHGFFLIFLIFFSSRWDTPIRRVWLIVHWILFIGWLRNFVSYDYARPFSRACNALIICSWRCCLLTYMQVECQSKLSQADDVYLL
jgi:hypothetical protein